jgi:hypothetical protein
MLCYRLSQSTMDYEKNLAGALRSVYAKTYGFLQVMGYHHSHGLERVDCNWYDRGFYLPPLVLPGSRAAVYGWTCSTRFP